MSLVYLIPAPLDDKQLEPIPAYVLTAMCCFICGE